MKTLTIIGVMLLIILAYNFLVADKNDDGMGE